MEKLSKDNRVHIGIYGKRNSGKSSLINKLSGQDIAIVSDIAGTTTDPVKKSYEILDYAPVTFIDTAGIDDKGVLGFKRVQKTIETIDKIDIAILLFINNTFAQYEQDLIREFKKFKTPFIIVHNKSDINTLEKNLEEKLTSEYNVPVLDISTLKKDINILIDTLKNHTISKSKKYKSLLGDIIKPFDTILLICPIDSEAPTGRLILPQVQTIRDILDNNCISIVLQEDQVEYYLEKSKLKPKLVITDSQIFKKVDKIIPQDIALTSFSTLLAKNKGNFEKYIEGTYHIDKLNNGDKILILESCSHQVSCEDIGRHKIPLWIKKYTNKNLYFDVIGGLDKINKPIESYSLIIQCGACMISKKQLKNRLALAIDKNIPVSNYGLSIAYTQGIFKRAIECFKK